MPRGFDRHDLRILNTLRSDARLTVVQLAERISLSTSPTWRRVKRLEDEGVISGYQATLDRRALGWGVLAFVQVSIEDHGEAQAREFEKAVAALPEIVACWSIAGSSDFLLQVVSQDLDTYADFAMNTVRRLPGIKEMQTIFTLKEVKPPAPWPIPTPT
ncbi:MAG TPA: Lrp/AsnC family transcriptional regulator [Pseudorhizobium sp.]|jgi:DNA-binding Lrp family transcriptional regulator|nr:Lrp/AsnC family transcriptional regulator [Pseudorhizobium sp.]